MTETRKLRVFLCHASQDKPVVRELYQRLLAEEWIDPWLDEEKLLPGQDWDLAIEYAVEGADAVIVCLSKNSVNKEGYVQRELRYVLDLALEKPEGKIFIIPLRLEDCQIPRRLRSWQYADYFPYGRRSWAYQKLLLALRKNKETVPDAFMSSDALVPVFDIDNGKTDDGGPSPLENQERNTKSNFSETLGLFWRPQLVGLIGALLGLAFYFMPWSAYDSGFEFSVGAYANFYYSPIFFMVPLVHILIIGTCLYIVIKKKSNFDLSLFLLDCNLFLLILFLSHVPWFTDKGLFGSPQIGYWGELAILVFVTLYSLYRVVVHNLFQNKWLNLMKVRILIYVLLLILMSFSIYFADEFF